MGISKNSSGIAPGVLHDPFILSDGTVNPGSTAVVESLNFDSSQVEQILTSTGSSASLYFGEDASYPYTQLVIDTINGKAQYYGDERETGAYWEDKSDSYDGKAGLTVNNYVGGAGVGRNLELYLNDDFGIGGDTIVAPIQGLIGRTTSYTTISQTTYGSGALALVSPNMTIPATGSSGAKNAIGIAYREGTLIEDDALHTRKIITDSSLNTAVVTDANSNARVVLNATSKNDVYLQTDSGGSTAYMGVFSDGASNVGYEIYSEEFYNLVTGNLWILYSDGFTLNKQSIVIDNSGGAWTTKNNADNHSIALSARNASVSAGVVNAGIGGGVGQTVDTDDTWHVANLNKKIDALGATTGTIDLDTAGNGITDGAYKIVSATGNIILNATTAYSTNNSARWYLEHTQNDGGAGTTTVTLGTNFIGTATTNTGSGAITIFEFLTRSDGKHVLMNTI